MNNLEKIQKTLKHFTELTEKLVTKPELKKHLTMGNKLVLLAARELDEVEGTGYEAMRKALDHYDLEMEKWLHILTTLSKQEPHATELKLEENKLVLKLINDSNEFRQKVVGLDPKNQIIENNNNNQNNENNAPPQPKSEEKPQVLNKTERDPKWKDSTTELRFKGAIQKLTDTRERELNTNRQLKQEVEHGSEVLAKARDIALKFLDEALENPQVAGVKAEQVKKLAKQANEDLLKMEKHLNDEQSKFFPFRNAFTWGSTINEFSFIPEGLNINEVKVARDKLSDLQKRYQQELDKQLPVFNQAIQMGADAHGVVASMKAMINELLSIGELCMACSQGGQGMEKFVLEDLTVPKGTSTRASFLFILELDDKRAAKKLIVEIQKKFEGAAKEMKNYMEAKKEVKPGLWTLAVANWQKLRIAWDDLNNSIDVAANIVAQAKKRIPKKLAENPEIQQAIAELEKMLQGVQEERDSMGTNTMTKLLKLANKLGIDI